MQHVLAGKPPGRARGIYRYIYFPIGLKNKVGRMEIGPFSPPGVFLVEGASHLGNEFWIKPISHGESEVALIDCLPGQLLRVHGGRNNLNAFLLDLRCAGVGLKLLQAESSPMSTVKEDDPPFTQEVVGENDLPSANLAHFQAREHISRVEKLVVRFWNFNFLLLL